MGYIISLGVGFGVGLLYWLLKGNADQWVRRHRCRRVSLKASERRTNFCCDRDEFFSNTGQLLALFIHMTDFPHVSSAVGSSRSPDWPRRTD